eukprot:240901-Prorocentrum_minimum.AAC.12
MLAKGTVYKRARVHPGTFEIRVCDGLVQPTFQPPQNCKTSSRNDASKRANRAASTASGLGQSDCDTWAALGPPPIGSHRVDRVGPRPIGSRHVGCSPGGAARDWPWGAWGPPALCGGRRRCPNRRSPPASPEGGPRGRGTSPRT